MNTSSGRSWIVHLMELLMELKGGVEEICDGVVSAMPVGQVHSLLVLLGVHMATFFPRTLVVVVHLLTCSNSALCVAVLHCV